MNKVHAFSHARIRIVMERSFDSFSLNDKAIFLNDLSDISGCPTSEFRDIVFKKGCVYFEGRLERSAVDRMLELFQKLQKKEHVSSEDIEQFQEFINKHSITNIFDLRVTIITPSKAKAGQVFFVHGWNGDAGTFGKLPEYISSNIEAETLIYDYPTGLLRPSYSLDFVWRNLDNWIRNRLESEKIAIICHSMGGLIIRKLVVSQEHRESPLTDRIKQLTFMASPHDGSVLAEIGRHVPGIQKAQFNELSAKSSWLFDLNERWLHWSRNNVPRNCKVRAIVGTDDKIVTINNARGLDPEAVPILGATHTDIVKPKSYDDEVVRTVIRYLKEAGFAPSSTS